jgi:hypothetical protein
VAAGASGAALATGAAPSASAAADDASRELAVRNKGPDFDIQILRKHLG